MLAVPAVFMLLMASPRVAETCDASRVASMVPYMYMYMYMHVCIYVFHPN
jgi:hypothetical protein